MSAEHEHHSNTEALSHSAELEAAAQDRLEQLRDQPEANHETAEQRAEAAREAIGQHKDEAKPVESEHANSRPTALLNHVLNYRQTLASLQRQLSPASRRFSKVIHGAGVEQTSQVLEKTIFRPSISLGATSTAFIVGLFFYVSARHYGFRLSGSEVLISLVIGAVIGLLIEGVISLFRRN